MHGEVNLRPKEVTDTQMRTCMCMHVSQTRDACMPSQRLPGRASVCLPLSLSLSPSLFASSVSRFLAVYLSLLSLTLLRKLSLGLSAAVCLARPMDPAKMPEQARERHTVKMLTTQTQDSVAPKRASNGTEMGARGRKAKEEEDDLSAYPRATKPRISPTCACVCVCMCLSMCVCVHGCARMIGEPTPTTRKGHYIPGKTATLHGAHTGRSVIPSRMCLSRHTVVELTQHSRLGVDYTSKCER